MRIYISGAITTAKHPQRDFERAERYLRETFPDAEIINPFRVGAAISEGAMLTWSEYMSIDFDLLRLCDHIYFIRGWENSEGCRRERVFAENNQLTEITFTPRGIHLAPMKTALKCAE